MRQEGAGVATRVVVVGAGVSGCACAAVLAEGNIHVTLLNPSLDRVGEPAFGPVLARGGEEAVTLEETLERLPASMSDAWRGALLLAPDEKVWVCDRRLVSIGVKRALEDLPGVELRQGQIVGLKVVRGADGGVAKEGALTGRGGVCVETAFGEEIWGDVVVIAVGLSLGGRVSNGKAVVGAGQYGLPASEGLERALLGLGGKMLDRELRVEPRVRWNHREAHRPGGAGSPEVTSAGKRGSGGGYARLALQRVGTDVTVTGASDGPPSPYEEGAVWEGSGLGGWDAEERIVPLAWPDGVATGELAVEGSCAAEEILTGVGGEAEGLLSETRPTYGVEGRVVENLGEGGLLEAWERSASAGGCGGSVWVTGRAGGAEGYAASLAAGVRTAGAIERALECRPRHG